MTMLPHREPPPESKNEINESQHSSAGISKTATTREIDRGRKSAVASSKPSSTPSSTSQVPSQEYTDSPWTENEKLKLKALKKIYQKPYQGSNNAWTCDWKQIAREMNRRPGDCLRQHCSFAQNAWSREEDIRLLTIMDSGELDASKITSIIYPLDSSKLNRVKDRIQRLQLHQLHTMALYQGLFTTDDEDGSADLVHILDKLDISDTAQVDGHVNPLEKALDDAISELDRQKERIKKINKDWCTKCAHTMVERDYSIYYTYYKHDNELKNAIVSGKKEPTLETVLPKVIDAYARSRDVCGYCGRKILFRESVSIEEQAPTAASADHFAPRKMAFNSDTYLHFTCRQCNYAKSNATDAMFKSYLQDIKAFYYTPDKLFSDHIPLDDENKRQAWLTWNRYKKARYMDKSHNAPDSTSQQVADFTNVHNDDDKIPPSSQMDADDLLFMDMVDAMGLRDPMTGAVGVFDSTMTKSNRFIITSWNWDWHHGNNSDKKIVTGFDIQQFTSLKIQLIMKFTKDAQVKFGNIKHFYSWLEAIQGIGHGIDSNCSNSKN